MTETLRCSPITFDLEPARVEERDGWRVALEYRGESRGPFLVDLSHLPCWDIQDGDLARFNTAGLEIPAEMNAVRQEGGLLISRMNQTQCQVWALGDEMPPWPPNVMATEITDGQALLAIVGQKIDSILETVTSLDLFGPTVVAPRLFQGPVLKIPCQAIRLDSALDMEAVLLAFPRGYGQAMADALLKSGASYGLTPGGEHDFKAILA